MITDERGAKVRYHACERRRHAANPMIFEGATKGRSSARQLVRRTGIYRPKRPLHVRAFPS